MEKKKRRLENKLSKLESFLDLSKKKKTTDEDDQSSSAAKVPKLDANEDSCWSVERLAKVRTEIRAQQKANMQKPKVYLTPKELVAPPSIRMKYESLPEQPTDVEHLPLFVMDLQHLLLYALQGNFANYRPRWCKLLRMAKLSHVVTIVIDGISNTEYTNHATSFPYMTSAFEMSSEITPPAMYGSDAITELFTVHMTISQIKDYRVKRKAIAKGNNEGSENKAGKDSTDKRKKKKKKNGDDVQQEPETELESEPITRLNLLLNPQQMISEGYPIPVTSPNTEGFVYSIKGAYAPVTANSPMFGLDCEMCLTTKIVNELTRVSVVNEQVECVYDALVKPYSRIIDHLTQYSGITKEMLVGVDTRLQHVQQAIQNILPPDAILIGQSLQGDLKALKLFHPYVIDTSVIYNLNGVRWMKSGLKKLSAEFLHKTIQDRGALGHSPIEDAASALELVQHKLEKGYTEYGDRVLGWTGEDSPSYPTQAKPANEKQALLANLHQPQLDPNADHTRYDDTQDNDNMEQSDVENTDNNTTDRKTTDNKTADNKTTENTDEVTKRSKFFKYVGGDQYRQRLVNVTRQSGKSVHLVGNNEQFWLDAETQPDAINLASIQYTETSSDKESCKAVTDGVTKSFFSLVHFKGCQDNAKVDNVSKLKKIDARVKKIISQIPESALVTVLFSGRIHENTAHNALCLLKIT